MTPRVYPKRIQIPIRVLKSISDRFEFVILRLYLIPVCSYIRTKSNASSPLLDHVKVVPEYYPRSIPICVLAILMQTSN
ncbi:MAG: hypothetical protein WBZ50_10095, partial [Nitrososphaeraceae archaeon]